MGQIHDLEQFKRKAGTPEPERVSLPDVLKTSHTAESVGTALVPEDNALTGEVLPPAKVPEIVVPNQPDALSGVDLTKLYTRAELLAHLYNNLPKNEYGLPRHLYRADLIDPQIFYITEEDGHKINAGDKEKYEFMQQALENAVFELTYREGYPTFKNGCAIWEALPYESVDDFQLFESYRLQPGGRQLQLLDYKVREHASELFHTCYWNVRCVASDAFAVVHMRRQREQRILRSDDNHFLASERLLDRFQKLEEEINWDTLKDSPVDFVQCMERLQKMQRQSLGLVSANGSGVKVPEGITSVEISMRRAQGDPVQQSEGETVKEGTDITKLLTDESTLKTAQELILKVQAK
jgi:hypothetical protein